MAGNLSRRVDVTVALNASGNLKQQLAENERQADRLQQAMARQPAGASITRPAPGAAGGAGQQQPVTVNPGIAAMPPAGQQPAASVQDRLAARLALRGQRAEFIGGEGAALYQQVALSEERVRGEQQVAALRAKIINLAQPEEAAQQRLEMLLGARVQKQQMLLQLQARESITGGGRDRGIFDQIAGLGAVQAAQQQVAQSRGQLFAMQNPRGRAALIEQATLTRRIGQEQRAIELESRFGRVGGTAAGIGMQALPVVGTIAAAAAAGLALFHTAIGGLPTVTQQVDNSFASLKNEIGIALIPAAKGLSGVFQQAAAVIRRFNETDFGRGAAAGAEAGLIGSVMGAVGLVAKPAFDLGGQRGEGGSGYEAGQLALYQGTEDQRRQEAEAFRRMTESIDRLNGTIADRVPPREGV